jgi:nucleotide-binding universal stress UspA family protein
MPLPYHKILCPMDFDENSIVALETAAEFARHFGRLLRHDIQCRCAARRAGPGSSCNRAPEISFWQSRHSPESRHFAADALGAVPLGNRFVTPVLGAFVHALPFEWRKGRGPPSRSLEGTTF